MQISKIHLTDPLYPEYLREISAPPADLYVRGQLPVGPCISVVGTRQATPYGLHVTYQIVGELAAAGFTIVSGLAMGIDAMAHRAALDAGGKTIAVLAGNLDTVYPAANRSLANEILEAGGALISETPVGKVTFKNLFVARNRIISGLSVATLITEAPDKSGASYTVNFALAQDRPCYAVPGRITDTNSILCNDLIQKGEARCTLSAQPILEDFRVLLPGSHQPMISARDPREIAVLQAIKAGNTTTHQLIEALNMSAGELSEILTLLELGSKARNLGAGQWAARAGRAQAAQL